MSWVLVIGFAWALLSLPVALLIGRGLRIADRRDQARRTSWVPDFIPANVLASVAASRRQS